MFNFSQVSFYASLAKTWIKARLGEQTTYDGVVIVALCSSYIIFDSIITIGAYAGIIYGLWSIYKEQK